MAFVRSFHNMVRSKGRIDIKTVCESSRQQIESNFKLFAVSFLPLFLVYSCRTSQINVKYFATYGPAFETSSSKSCLKTEKETSLEFWPVQIVWNKDRTQNFLKEEVFTQLFSNADFFPVLIPARKPKPKCLVNCVEEKNVVRIF